MAPKRKGRPPTGGGAVLNRRRSVDPEAVRAKKLQRLVRQLGAGNGVGAAAKRQLRTLNQRRSLARSVASALGRPFVQTGSFQKVWAMFNAKPLRKHAYDYELFLPGFYRQARRAWWGGGCAVGEKLTRRSTDAWVE